MALSSSLCAFKLEDYLGPLVIHGGFIGMINNSSKVILVYGPITLIKVHLVKVLHVHGISWLEFIGLGLIQWHISFGLKALWCTLKVHFTHSIKSLFKSISLIPLSHDLSSFSFHSQTIYCKKCQSITAQCINTYHYNYITKVHTKEITQKYIFLPRLTFGQLVDQTQLTHLDHLLNHNFHI